VNCSSTVRGVHLKRCCPRLALKLVYWMRIVSVSALLTQAAWSAFARSDSGSGSPSSTLPTLTTARAAHNLSTAEAARRYPVHLRAVVTYYDPSLGHDFAALFVNDHTGGIYVRLPADTIPSLPSGTLVDVRGVSGNGSFAPYVEFPHVTILGPSHLPEKAERVTRASLFSGADDGKWVEVEGTVHSVSTLGRTVTLELAMADGAISVIMMAESGVDYIRLVDAKVRIHANVAPLLSRVKFQMIGARLMAPDLSALRVLEPAPLNPFDKPVIPINELFRWDWIPNLNHRVHLRGTVTLQWPGSSLCLRDATGSICTQSTQQGSLSMGSIVDVVGFGAIEGEAHVLSDAVFHRIGQGEVVVAVPLTPDEVLSEVHDSQLIQIEGQVIGHDIASTDATLMLSAGRTIFSATLPAALTATGVRAWPIGSHLRITGICSVRLDVQSSAVGEGIAVARSFRVLLRSPADIVVLQKPSWWTPGHTLIVLSLALTVTLAILAWVIVLRKRIQQQANLLRESENRFRHMALHDSLTGLATRILLQDRLDQAVQSSIRQNTGLAVLVVDLDFFKQINDTHGHLAGDEVLLVTATRLLAAVRKTDTVARLGGDEFVVLLTAQQDREAPKLTAAGIVRSLAVPIPFGDQMLHTSASVGVTIAFQHELLSESLITQADTALYRAKELGRNRFWVFQPSPAPQFTESL